MRSRSTPADCTRAPASSLSNASHDPPNRVSVHSVLGRRTQREYRVQIQHRKRDRQSVQQAAERLR